MTKKLSEKISDELCKSTGYAHSDWVYDAEQLESQLSERDAQMNEWNIPIILVEKEKEILELENQIEAMKKKCKECDNATSCDN